MPARKKATHLLQHAKTHDMNAVWAELTKRRIQVLADIHDAIIIRQRLSRDDMWVFIEEMQASNGNQYWRLSERQIDSFK